METTFSFFPGLFETHALAKYYFKKNKIKTVININFIWMRKK